MQNKMKFLYLFSFSFIALIIKLMMCDASKQYLSRELKVKNLRQILQSPKITIMPCCYDGLTARLIEEAGFNLTFMTGFGVSATFGLPDAGLVATGEMFQAGSTICGALQNIPCIGDADTGFGNEINVKRTVRKYVQAGFAGLMIEDQVSPKRCGHVAGKQVVPREEAFARVAAAVSARDEGEDIVVLARTDARGPLGIDEAIERCKVFRQLGADWTFLEAPQSEAEMRRYCTEVQGPKLANMLEFGSTPVLPPQVLEEMGYSVAAYPLTLLSASVRAMKGVLERLRSEQGTEDFLVPFSELRTVVGFDGYDAEVLRLRKVVGGHNNS